jgi:transcriptional regulator with GAF, ATPase, and Fis domain
MATAATLSSGLNECGERRFGQIVGESPALEGVFEKVKRVAATSSTVLIEGETGTGKELIARAIHNLSPRWARPFIKLNCAAIPFDLLESELFGHERGAFTGAVTQRIGRFEMAHTGTLFLDEVGDLPAALQPKLLRVLQEQEFERLGSGRTHHVDVRLLSATNRNLEKMVGRNQFRSDLYYRLNVFPIVLPPLRERHEDIADLVAHFVDVFSSRMGKQIKSIPEETIEAFKSYSWPGNIRELQNLIERAVILANDGVLPNPLPVSERWSPIRLPAITRLGEVERTLILKTLHGAGWVIGGQNGAATKLGLKRTTLIYKMNKLGIERPMRRSERKVSTEERSGFRTAQPTSPTG